MDVRLIYFKANGQRREVRLHNGLVTVGRGEDCQLRIPADTVSRRHCQIEVTDEDVVLTDLGSSNGTIVNGERIVDDDMELHAGDKIIIGPATFTIQIGTQPTKVEPSKQAAVEEELSGTSVADEGDFDPFSVLEDMIDETDTDVAPQPKQMAPVKRKPEEQNEEPDKASPKGQA